MNEILREDGHPKPEVLRRFLAGEADSAAARVVVRHLLADCPECRSVTAPLCGGRAAEGEARPGSPDPDYSRSVEIAGRVASQRIRQLRAEREAASHLVAALAAQPREGWQASLETDSRFRTWSLVSLLISGSRELCVRNPGKAVELADLAVAVSVRLPEEVYGRERLEDLQARACGQLGNAQRTKSDFQGAEKAFATAKEHLGRGTGDPLERAGILLLEASLQGDRARSDEAVALVEEVIRTARRYGDRHLQGKAFIYKALFAIQAGENESVLPALYGGIDLIDAAQEPRLVLVAWHNLIVSLSEQGKYEEALKKLPYVRSLHEKFGNHLDLVRFRWVEGRLSRELGDLTTAEQKLKEVRSEFIDAGIGFDAALVSLDLATLYLRRGETEKTTQLAREMLPIFKSRDVHRETIAALIVFQKAAEMEEVTLGLVEDLGKYLRQARNNPGLRFRPSN